MMGTTAHGGIVVVKNKQEWLESRRQLKERKKRGAKEGRASDEPAAFGFPLGRIEEQETDEPATHRSLTS